jgi:hypothetical protein
MVYVHTILRDVAGLFKVGRLVAYTGSAHVRTRSLEFSEALIEGKSRANRRTDTRATANFLRHHGRELREADQPQQSTHWLLLQASRMCAIGDAVCLTKLARG